MTSITTNQRDVLLSIEGTNIWSGQTIQTYNTQVSVSVYPLKNHILTPAGKAVAWGGLAKALFSVGGRYQWVTLSFLLGFIIPLPFYFLHRLFPRWQFDYWNTAIIAYNIGILEIGVNSSTLSYFVVGKSLFLQRYRRDLRVYT